MTRHVLIIGAQRCGTTYLYRLLDEHPQVRMAKPLRPEPKFFLDPEQYHRGLGWYEGTYFSDAGDDHLRGEKSTSYIESPAAAERAAAMLPDAHIVALLRDPLERAASNWRFSTAHGTEDRPLARALAENLRGSCPWDPAVTSVSPYAYLERGRYYDDLLPWVQNFPGRLHVRFLEHIAGKPDAVAELYAALELDPAFDAPSLQRPANVGEGPVPELDPSLREEVRTYFASSDRQLSRWLGQRLPWEHARR